MKAFRHLSGYLRASILLKPKVYANMRNPAAKLLSRERGDISILIAAVMALLILVVAFMSSLAPLHEQRRLSALKKQRALRAINMNALEVAKTLLVARVVDTTTWTLNGFVPNDLVGNLYCGGSTPSPQIWENGVAPVCGGMTTSFLENLDVRPLYATLGIALADLFIPESSGTGLTMNVGADGGTSSGGAGRDPHPGFTAQKPTLLLNLPTAGSSENGTAYVQFRSATATSVEVGVTSIVPSGSHWDRGTLVARIGQEGGAPPLVDPWSPDSCVFRNSHEVSYKGKTTYAPPGWETCPANYAVVTTSNGASYALICCPLPSSDILTGAVSSRSGTCGANELLVGATYSDNNKATVTCQGINTGKYKLGAAKTSCVWGSGSGGWAGASGCGTAPLIVGAKSLDGKSRTVGGDGCTGSPFGAFAVKRTSKQCGDQKYSQLQNLDGTAVEINYP